jgi:hypothetical protein
VALPLRAALRDGTRAHTLTVLRPKGEVPVTGAVIERVGDTRLRITVSPREMISRRPPYVLHSTHTAERDGWLDALRTAACFNASDRSDGGAPPASRTTSMARTTFNAESFIESSEGSAPG